LLALRWHLNEAQVRWTILLTQGNPFPTFVLCPCCSASFKCVSAWGEGRATPSCPPEPDQKPWLLLPPLYDANAKMYKTNHDNKEKRPCTAVLHLSVLFYPPASPGYEGGTTFLGRGGNAHSSRGLGVSSVLPQLLARTLWKSTKARVGASPRVPGLPYLPVLALQSQRSGSEAELHVPSLTMLPSSSSGCDGLRIPQSHTSGQRSMMDHSFYKHGGSIYSLPCCVQEAGDTPRGQPHLEDSSKMQTSPCHPLPNTIQWFVG
jgi:hypothetical protein